MLGENEKLLRLMPNPCVLRCKTKGDVPLTRQASGGGNSNMQSCRKGISFWFCAGPHKRAKPCGRGQHSGKTSIVLWSIAHQVRSLRALPLIFYHKWISFDEACQSQVLEHKKFFQAQAVSVTMGTSFTNCHS